MRDKTIDYTNGGNGCVPMTIRHTDEHGTVLDLKEYQLKRIADAIERIEKFLITNKI